MKNETKLIKIKNYCKLCGKLNSNGKLCLDCINKDNNKLINNKLINNTKKIKQKKIDIIILKNEFKKQIILINSLNNELKQKNKIINNTKNIKQTKNDNVILKNEFKKQIILIKSLNNELKQKNKIIDRLKKTNNINKQKIKEYNNTIKPNKITVKCSQAQEELLKKFMK